MSEDITPEEDGILEIEMDIHDEDHLVPVLYNNKVTIGIPTDDDYDEYSDSDDEDEYDDTEWIHDHPKDKSDNDPE